METLFSFFIDRKPGYAVADGGQAGHGGRTQGAQVELGADPPTW